MQINVAVKQLGKKKPPIASKQIDIDDLAENTLVELITHVVKQQVSAFNERLDKNPLVPFLLSEQINEQADTGKVGFGAIYNNEKANASAAIDNALLAFQDGLYCVFIDDAQIEHLQQTINLQTNSIVTFVRLTFLSGRLW